MQKVMQWMELFKLNDGVVGDDSYSLYILFRKPVRAHRRNCSMMFF
jgi:hypothetical protein